MNRLAINILIFLMISSLLACQSPYKYLKKRKGVECEFIGFKPFPSKSYPWYEKYRDQTELAEIVQHSQSRNLTTRTYAYWALIEKLDTGYVELFKNMLRDTSQVRERCGCTAWNANISTTAYMNYYEKRIDWESEKESKTFLLDGEEKLQKLDSVILKHKRIDEALISIVLENREYESEELLDRIVELAFIENHKDAGEYIKRNINHESFKNHRSRVLNMETDKLSESSKELLTEIRRISN